MKVLLGVCGGVAAYKAAELLRELQRRGCDVQVAMTEGATRFVQPLTFASLSGHPVLTSLWQPQPEATDASGDEFSIEHIAAVQGIAAMVIAPATASHLAKFAHGMSDDFLSTAYLAATAPVILAPAMNVNMWNHPATRRNVELLAARGHRFVSPGAGYLACGMVGGGRLAEVEAIADEVMRGCTQRTDLQGETVLVTAGGTREPIDTVRFIGNRSSGKMGFALAEAAKARGAKVILVSASPLPAPRGVLLHAVDTAEEMRSAVLGVVSECTLVLKAAAVADFRPEEVFAEKLRRSGSLSLRLTATADIVREVVEARRQGTIVVAFAAETEDALRGAREKLARKGVDAIFVNDVSRPGIGFDADENAGFFLTPSASVELGRMSKRQMADRILDEAMKLRVAKPIGAVAV
jgi:phosphopantothenoylcysteine decarboxylase/phosphopantothenate--cysteine ligase